MFEKSISHAMISYVQSQIETFLLGNMVVLQTILKPWILRFPAPTHTIHIMKETSIHIKWGNCACVMEFLYIYTYHFTHISKKNLISFSGSQRNFNIYPTSDLPGANGPYHLCLPSRGGKSGTPFGVKSFDRHQPVISLLDGLDKAWNGIIWPTLLGRL